MPIQIGILIVLLALANLIYYVWFKPSKYISNYIATYKSLPEWFPFRTLFISWANSRSSIMIWSLRIFVVILFVFVMTLIIYLARLS